MRIFNHILVTAVIILSLMISCGTNEHQSLINSNHLNHLYKEYDFNGDTNKIGTIWIYCDAPDYNLVADPDEGFTCVDDVARALVFWVRQYKRTPSEDILHRIKLTTRMILGMQDSTGYFFNFLYPDITINKEHKNSVAEPNFWSWRALWALSEANSLFQEANDKEFILNCSSAIEQLIKKMKIDIVLPDSTYQYSGVSVPSIINKHGSDQVGLMMIGLTNYNKNLNDPEIDALILRLGKELVLMQKGNIDTFPFGAFLSWQNLWHAWGNIQSNALLHAGEYLQNKQFIEAALLEIDNFYPYLLELGWTSDFHVNNTDGLIELIEHNRFPQIAYGVRPAVFACLKAYDLTQDDSYAIRAGELASWFFGNNPAEAIMYHEETGICFDGINSSISVNYNSGAESTIEALLTIQAIEKYPVALESMNKYARMD